MLQEIMETFPRIASSFAGIHLALEQVSGEEFGGGA
jgi:hypothetical protein